MGEASLGGADRRGVVKAPPLVRASVPGAAALSAVAFGLAFAQSPQLVLLVVWSGLALLGGALYLRYPVVGGWLLVAGGVMAASIALFALAFGGGAPWLLVAFWASAAMLLAGLLAVIEMRDSQARLAGVTVLAILSLLVLSAVSLVLYMRYQWSDAERQELERVPLQVSRSGQRLPPADYELEAAPGGQWARYWTYGTTTDPERVVRDAARRLEADGWAVHEGDAFELIAEKPGYRMRIAWEETPAENPGPGKYRAADPKARARTVSFAAYLQER